ncbi:hypothetical protein D9758_013220 [Tetrapyrgos nigripes]|uniref:TPR-like protein n=1 Tax=Tetrapyrgos nigripes TaxID=182062 RepID=A0A8H5CSN2_9AGAR|nr:hypothetical protein D9758_013220 [Tetrapyrgos nigripes]
MEDPSIKEKFAERCYFIPCEMLPDATILIQGLVQAIGLPVAQGKDSFKLLLDYLRGGQQVLLVLDNFETPWGSRDQTKVKNLIEMVCRCQSVSVIVTMRGTDGPGQIKWHKLGGGSGLPALELSAAKEAFCSFCSDGDPTIEEKDPFLEKLLIQMDGMPLAIMLIAELAKELPLNDLMEMWNIQKTAVMMKIGEEETRLTSIEVSIQLTLNILRGKLSTKGEDVLRLVAFLPSGIPDWLRNLPKMVSDATMQVLILKKSCLVYETRDKTLKILTPIGEYIMKIFQGTEHLENPVWKFYESFIDNLPQDFIAGDIQLRLHTGNIFKILQIQIEKSFERSYMKVLQKLCQYSKYYSDLVLLIENYLGWKSQMSVIDQIEVMFMQEYMFSFMGEYGKAIEIINDVEKLYNQETSLSEVVMSTGSISANNKIQQTQAECYYRLGMIFYYQRNHMQSQQKVQQAKDLYESIGDIQKVAQCLRKLGDICWMLYQYEDAKVMLQQAKEQFEGVGDRLGAVQCLQSLGNMYKMLNQYEDAKVILEQAKEQFEGAGDRLGAVQCLRSLGEICRMLNQYEDAKVMLQQAKEQFKEIGERLGAAQCLQSLGDICLVLLQHKDAKVMFQQAKEQFEGVGERLGAAECLRSLGNICRLLSQHEDAKVMLQQAKEQFEGVGDKAGAAQCLQIIGDICSMQNQHEDAKVMLHQAQKQFQGVGDRQGAAQCLQSLGNVCRMLYQHEDAKVMLQQAKEQFDGIGSRLGAANCLCSLAIIDYEQGHLIEAKAKFEKAKEHFEAIQMPQRAAPCVVMVQEINHALAVAVENQA